MELLPVERLVRTDDIDVSDQVYRPWLGSFHRLRYHLLLELIGDRFYENLLEIGYGNGIFMPELARRCQNLYGVDAHPFRRDVAATLAGQGIEAELFTGASETMPVPENSMDCVVAVGPLENVEDPGRLCREVLRVLRAGGSFLVVLPSQGVLQELRAYLWSPESSTTGERVSEYEWIAALTGHFELEARRAAPPLLSPLVRLHTGLRLRNGGP